MILEGKRWIILNECAVIFYYQIATVIMISQCNCSKLIDLSKTSSSTQKLAIHSKLMSATWKWHLPLWDSKRERAQKLQKWQRVRRKYLKSRIFKNRWVKWIIWSYLRLNRKRILSLEYLECKINLQSFQIRVIILRSILADRRKLTKR